MSENVTTVPQLSIYQKWGFWNFSVDGPDGHWFGGHGYDTNEEAWAAGKRFLNGEPDDQRNS